jgi:polysaccharide export outer membrane protein
MKKTIILLFIFVILCWGFSLPLGFTEGTEWQRIRPSNLEGTVKGEDSVIQAQGSATVEYYVSAGDVMDVFVWQNPDLSKEVIVGPDGFISYPLVGRFKAVGLTMNKLEDKFKAELSNYIKFPQVSIMIKKFAGQKIIILGEVLYPGIYAYQGKINLIDAVALAGDFTKEAHQRSVLLVRGGFSGEPQVKRIDMVEVITQGITKSDITLQANDVIYVPRTFVANFNKFMSDLSTVLNNTSTAMDVRSKFRTQTGHSR